MQRDDEPADPVPPPPARDTAVPDPRPPAAEPGRQLAEALARARHLNDLLVAMREVTALLRHERDRQRLLDGVCGCLVRTRGYVAVWIGEPDDATGEVRSVAHAGTGSGFQAHAPIRWDEGPLGQGPTGTALRERRPVVFDDLALDPRFAPWRGPVLAAGAASIASVPLLHQGAPLGVLTVEASRAAAFDAEEVELLRGLAEEVGHALQALEDERALRESEETLRTVFESSPIGLEIFDRDGVLVRCNRRVSELFGMDESAYLGRFRLRDDPNSQDPDVWARLDRGEEVRHRAAFDFGRALYPSTKSGLAFHDVTTTPVPASVSPRIGYVMQIVDVTGAERAEDRRRASEERDRLGGVRPPEGRGGARRRSWSGTGPGSRSSSRSAPPRSPRRTRSWRPSPTRSPTTCAGRSGPSTASRSSSAASTATASAPRGRGSSASSGRTARSWAASSTPSSASRGWGGRSWGGPRWTWTAWSGASWPLSPRPPRPARRWSGGSCPGPPGTRSCSARSGSTSSRTR